MFDFSKEKQIIMSYPYGGPYGPPYGQPPTQPQPYGTPYGSPYGQPPNPMMTMMMCSQSSGLGGKQQMIPINGPINLQQVVQQAVMYLMGQGFQAFPMVGQNLAVIQAQHSSLLDKLTDQSKAYTVRICVGPEFVMVETGISNLMQELLTAGVTVGISDELLHNNLLTMAGGGIDAYGLYKDYAGEEQLMNIITMAIMSAQTYPQQYGSYGPYGPPYGQPPTQPQPYGTPYGSPYGQPGQPSQYPQQPQQPPQLQNQPRPTTPSPQPAPQTKVKCWKCGAENDSGAKFCENCGSPLTSIKCPKCGKENPAGSKFCSECGTNLQQTINQ
ncbi:zinc ribbon domain-containing protein [Sulfuracidifex metallicus]|nr:zinc ribbon domain-containing protein [Sulfuracidifex metallicus]WOE49990.1 zinc ribbon domain-containing protein [Sulfuracidifex metallicus DSM 6482 = JCM 9184]